MIEYIFGKYLSQYIDKNIPITFDSSRKLGLIIVATKTSYWLPLVIKNAAEKISNANIYFVGPQHCIDFIQSQFVNNKISYIQYKLIGDFNTIKSYNWLLLNPEFWQQFNEEFLLIFQPDCIILRDIEPNFYNYDYIGAVCGNISEENTFIINGGLSLRRRQAMIDVCNSLNKKESSGEYAEDIIFTHKIRNNIKYNKKFPSIELCNHFAIESSGNIDTCVGIHGTDKYYIHPTILSRFSTSV